MLTVRLDAETERRMKQMARQRRVSRSALVREAIGLLYGKDLGDAQARRPYDEMEHVIGCADSGDGTLSEDTGEKFATALRQKARARRSR